MENEIISGASECRIAENGEQPALYVIADTHLSFSSGKPMDVFGSRWKNYTEKLERSWRTSVRERDTVVIPGDISWAMTLDEAREDMLFLESLPGKKLISKGNHDFWWSTNRKITEFFEKNDIKSINMLYNNAFLFGRYALCGTRGWFNDEKAAPEETDYRKIVDRECQRLELSFKAGLELCRSSFERASAGEGFDAYGCEPLVFMHFPPYFKNYICRGIIDMLHKYGVRRCFYGHIHSVYDFKQTVDFEGIDFICIAGDYLDFKPYRIKFG